MVAPDIEAVVSMKEDKAAVDYCLEAVEKDLTSLAVLAEEVVDSQTVVGQVAFVAAVAVLAVVVLAVAAQVAILAVAPVAVAWVAALPTNRFVLVLPQLPAFHLGPQRYRSSYP